MTKSRATAIALAAVLFVLPAATAIAGFSEVVAAIEAKGGRHKTVIPLFGLVRVAIRIAHPSGVHDLELATWEDRQFFLDGRDIEPLLHAKAGADYRPMIATRSRSGEWTFIYARPVAGNLIDMLLVTHDKSDTVVLHTIIEPERLGDEMSHHHGRDGHVNVAWK